MFYSIKIDSEPKFFNTTAKEMFQFTDEVEYDHYDGCNLETIGSICLKENEMRFKLSDFSVV